MRSPEAANNFSYIAKRAKELSGKRVQNQPSLAERYIKRRIETTTTVQSEELAVDADIHLRSFPPETKETLVRDLAVDGHVDLAASLLKRNENLAPSKKADILAKAYARRALRYTNFADNAPDNNDREETEKEAQRSEIISQSFKRAARRIRNSAMRSRRKP